MSILSRIRAWLFGSPSLDAARAGEQIARDISAGLNAPERDAHARLAWKAVRHALWPERWPALTPEEQTAFDAEDERRRRVPPAPAPDWWSRSPLAHKARLRRQRKRAAKEDGR